MCTYVHILDCLLPSDRVYICIYEFLNLYTYIGVSSYMCICMYTCCPYAKVYGVRNRESPDLKTTHFIHTDSSSGVGAHS